MRNGTRYPATPRRAGGFSLVELMVGMVIGLLAIFAITQTFTVSELQKRTTTGGADAQTNGLIALFTIERDLKNAGLGILGLGCPQIKVYNENSPVKEKVFDAIPVVVTQNDPVAGTDKIAVVYSVSTFAGIPSTVTDPMPDSSAILNVNLGQGVVEGDMVLVSEPGKAWCTIIQASQDGQKTGKDWNVQHNSGGSFPFNPAGGQNIFPPGGYTTGAKLTNMGTMVNREYFIQNNNLMMRDLNQPDGTNNPLTLVDEIIALRAQYGRDANNNGFIEDTEWNNTAPADDNDVIAIRIAAVARSSQRELATVSQASLPLWDGDPTPLVLDAEAQHYRYRVYQTTVPLRNVIWSF